MGYTARYTYNGKSFTLSDIPGYRGRGLSLCLSVEEAKNLSPDELLAISQWFQANAHDIDHIFRIDHILCAGADYARMAPKLNERLRELFSIWRETDDEIVRQEAERTIGRLSDLNIPEPPPPDTKGNEGWVYLLESGPYYKIGFTSNVEQRVKSLGTLPPFDLTLVCTIKTDSMCGLERELHERFAQKRKNGEWFELDPEDVEYIKGLAT